MLSCHFHPSVKSFSESVLSEKKNHEISYKGDPLRDFTLINFLDRFAFRNPKSAEKLKKQYKLNESVAERRSGGRGLKEAGKVAVNDPKFLSGKEGDINENEQFFYKFFAEKAKRDVMKGVRKSGASGDDAEKIALEDAEVVDSLGEVNFDGEVDDEEEKFAMQLAEDLMKQGGQGMPNYDNEDVDMEGWSDLDSLEDEEEEEGDDHSDDDNDDDDDDDDFGGDDDAFGGDDDGDDDDFGGEESAFVEAEDSEDNDDDDDDDDDDDSDNDLDVDEDEIAFFQHQVGSGSDSDSDGSHGDNSKNKKTTKNKNLDFGDSPFADADDDKIVNEVEDEFWAERDKAKAKRAASEISSGSDGGKKKRRRSRKNKQ